MISRRTRLRGDTGPPEELGNFTDSPSIAHPLPATLYPNRAHTSGHESVFQVRAVQLEIRLHSPSIKVLKPQAPNALISVPVFGDHDHISGTISLDPRSCCSPGRVTLSLVGAFLLTSEHGQKNSERKHIFFTSSQVFNTSEPHSGSGSIYGSSFREAFANTVRSRRFDRRTGVPTFSASTQSIPFEFEMPRPIRQGQEMPPTLNITSIAEDGSQGKTLWEHAEVSYMVTALWEASDGSDRAFVEAPIVFQPDTDFHSLDGLSLEHRSWLELPLRIDRPSIPFQCAITLPNPASFPRSASVPYFVVFKTLPRSRTLIREIAADATIAVSLLRIVTTNTSRPYTVKTLPNSPASTPRGSPFPWGSVFSDDEPDLSTSSLRRMKRAAKGATPTKYSSFDDLRRPSAQAEDNEPAITAPSVSETRTLQTDICIGFPKRPRNRCGPDGHPSLDAHASLPDGLYKGKTQLNANMLPSINWAGLNVKYYLDVSVLFRQDELRARVPIRIF